MSRKIYRGLLTAAIFMGCSDGKFTENTKQKSLPSGAGDQEAPRETEVDPNESEPVDSSNSPIPAKYIEFGAVEAFHIGDGSIGGGSACVDQVKSYDLKGTTYYFEFEVLEENTSVDMAIGKICGVDATGLSTILVRSEEDSQVVLPETILPTDNESDRSQAWVPYPRFNLAKGLYSVVIRTKNVLGKPLSSVPVPGTDEFDDFIVGNINLNADKPVKAGKIYAE